MTATTMLSFRDNVFVTDLGYERTLGRAGQVAVCFPRFSKGIGIYNTDPSFMALSLTLVIIFRVVA